MASRVEGVPESEMDAAIDEADFVGHNRWCESLSIRRFLFECMPARMVRQER